MKRRLEELAVVAFVCCEALVVGAALGLLFVALTPIYIVQALYLWVRHGVRKE